jgi:hypothetical protein
MCLLIFFLPYFLIHLLTFLLTVLHPPYFPSHIFARFLMWLPLLLTFLCVSFAFFVLICMSGKGVQSVIDMLCSYSLKLFHNVFLLVKEQRTELLTQVSVENI